MPNLTPGGWLDLLDTRLRERQAHTKLYEDYYNGKHRLAFATVKFRETFGSLFAAFADNWCQLVVDAAVERLKVEGFRFGDDASSDDAAWEIWQKNGLDADSKLAHREAVKCGESYILVDPNGGDPKITVEHPIETIVAMAPGNRRQRLAGLKRWLDADGYLYATLYLPDRVYKFKSQRKAPSYVGYGRVNWQTRPDDSGGPNPLGVVPLIPVCNSPSMMWGGQSDLQQAIPLQDAANKLISDMLVASEFQAFQQRWAAGLELPKDPQTGAILPAAQLEAAVSRMMVSESADTKFGAFPQVDLKPYVSAVEMIVQHLAAQTRTPPHYLLGQSGAFPSGESLQSTETGLVARVEDKQVTFGEAWEEALRLAFRALRDDARASAIGAETIWRDPESRTEGEHIDATLKLQALGVPEEALWERAGFTPQQIKRFRRIKDKEARRLGRLMNGAGASPNGETAPPNGNAPKQAQFPVATTGN